MGKILTISLATFVDQQILAPAAAGVGAGRTPSRRREGPRRRFRHCRWCSRFVGIHEHSQGGFQIYGFVGEKSMKCRDDMG